MAERFRAGGGGGTTDDQQQTDDSGGLEPDDSGGGGGGGGNVDSGEGGVDLDTGFGGGGGGGGDGESTTATDPSGGAFAPSETEQTESPAGGAFQQDGQAISDEFEGEVVEQTPSQDQVISDDFEGEVKQQNGGELTGSGKGDVNQTKDSKTEGDMPGPGPATVEPKEAQFDPQPGTPGRDRPDPGQEPEPTEPDTTTDPSGGAFAQDQDQTTDSPAGGAFQEEEKAISDEYEGSVIEQTPSQEQVISDEFEGPVQEQGGGELQDRGTGEVTQPEQDTDTEGTGPGRGPVDQSIDPQEQRQQVRERFDPRTTLNRVAGTFVDRETFTQEVEQQQEYQQTGRDWYTAVEQETRPGEQSDIEVDTEVTDRLTRGAILSETPESSEGLLPGRVAGVNVSEQGFRSAAEDVRNLKEPIKEAEVGGLQIQNEALRDAAGDVPGVQTGDDGTVKPPGSEYGAAAFKGVTADFGVELLAAGAQAPALADTAVEIPTNFPGVAQEQGAEYTGQQLYNLGAWSTQAGIRRGRAKPVRTGAAAAAGIITGIYGGRLAGKVGRKARDRYRTFGSVDVTDDVMGRDVRRYIDTEGDEGRRFPPARTESGDVPSQREFIDRQKQILRSQAERKTPDVVEERFARRGYTEGAVYKKTLDVEPEGPRTARASRGFETPDPESDLAGAYETVGTSMGPEVSPYFFGVNARRSFSLRPGLPDFGGKPTGILARTDLDTTDARYVDELNEELLDREGDATPVTLSPDQASPGEAEVLAPPGATYRDIGGGVTRNVARRFGFGSDFRVEIGGRRVPLRPVVPEGDVDATGPTVFGRGTRGQADLTGPDAGDGVAFRGSLDELARRGGRPVDRPFPTVPVGGTSGTEVDSAVSGDAEGTDTLTRGTRVDTSDRTRPAGARARDTGGSRAGQASRGTSVLSDAFSGASAYFAGGSGYTYPEPTLSGTGPSTTTTETTPTSPTSVFESVNPTETVSQAEPTSVGGGGASSTSGLTPPPSGGPSTPPPSRPPPETPTTLIPPPTSPPPSSPYSPPAGGVGTPPTMPPPTPPTRTRPVDRGGGDTEPEDFEPLPLPESRDPIYTGFYNPLTGEFEPTSPELGLVE
jgi:hypothetical protein